MKPIHRGVVGLTEPGAATSAMVALTASQRAVAHYVSSGTIGIGTGRFGIRGTHLEPLADLTCPHILQESLPVFQQAGVFSEVGLPLYGVLRSFVVTRWLKHVFRLQT